MKSIKDIIMKLFGMNESEKATYVDYFIVGKNETDRINVGLHSRGSNANDIISMVDEGCRFKIYFKSKKYRCMW